MIIGVGVDVCHIGRFEQMLARRPGIAIKLFTPHERTMSVTSQAGRFAAKEALAKALGSPGGMRWTDCEVVRHDDGRPHFALQGTVKKTADDLGIDVVHVSISHDAGVATAFVIAERTAGGNANEVRS
ncbi:holo-ACP synthase [Propionibacteriaceae bacterium G57]|uniref:holo-ACP synthase n=1 Tax=Aestuariimicrobium sp. G57 TaxID=3418485 RepID=UPI003DA762EA